MATFLIHRSLQGAILKVGIQAPCGQIFQEAQDLTARLKGRPSGRAHGRAWRVFPFFFKGEG